MGGGRARSTGPFFLMRMEVDWRCLGAASWLLLLRVGLALRAVEVWNWAVAVAAGAAGAAWGACVGGKRAVARGVGRSRERQLQQKEDIVILAPPAMPG